MLRELKHRFEKFVETKDESYIPGDIMRVTFLQAVTFGGVREWEAMFEIFQTASSPAMRTGAL